MVLQVALGADDKEGRLLPKALPHLHLHAGGARLPQLAALAERAAASLTDKAALRHVQKLQERLALLAIAGHEEGEQLPSVEDTLAAHRSAAARVEPPRQPAPRPRTTCTARPARLAALHTRARARARTPAQTQTLTHT